MKLMVVIPAHNEEATVADVVEDVRRHIPSADYVVVNDGSLDNTRQICEQIGCKVLNIPVNIGLFGAFQTGVRYAYEKGYDAVVQIDGDGQHHAKYIEDMAKKMEQEKLDLLVGSRFITEKRPKNMRMIGNAMIEFAIRLTTGRRVTDPTSGMRMYGKRLLKMMAYGINSKPEPDTVAFLLRNGIKYGEYQVTMSERTAGSSYLDFWQSVKYMLAAQMNIYFVQWFRRKEDL